MKKYARLFKYLRFYKGNIGLYFLFTLLSIVFSVVSIGTLPFFLGLIFKNQLKEQNTQVSTGSAGFIQYINAQISDIIQSHGTEGPLVALGIICILIITMVLLKNVFLYLSFYVLAPMKNSVMTA